MEYLHTIYFQSTTLIFHLFTHRLLWIKSNLITGILNPYSVLKIRISQCHGSLFFSLKQAVLLLLKKGYCLNKPKKKEYYCRKVSIGENLVKKLLNLKMFSLFFLYLFLHHIISTECWLLYYLYFIYKYSILSVKENI